MKFRIQTLDASGKSQTLTEDFADEKALRKEIKKRGLTILKASPDKGGSSGLRELLGPLATLFQSSTYSLKEKELFVGELLLLLDSGVKLQVALGVMARSLQRPRDQQVVQGILTALTEGRSFPEALESRGVLGATEIGVLKAGEAGGEFKEMLHLVHQNLRQRISLQRQLLSLLAYPILLLFLASGVFSFLSFKVLPQLTKFYEELHVQLPAGTWLVIKALAFIDKGGWIILLLLAGMVLYLVNLVRKNPAPFQRRFFKVPYLGDFLRRYLLLGFLPSLTLYLRKKLPPREAVENLKVHFVKSPLLLGILEGVLENLKKGVSLTQAFKESPLFSAREKELLEIGESSSRVVETLDRIQENTKAEQEEQTKRSVTLLEPIIIVAIGGLVLFFVVVFILPLLTMEQSF